MLRFVLRSDPPSDKKIQKKQPAGPSSTLQSLTSAALLLPGLLAAPAHAAESDSGSVSFQFSRYQEGKRNLYSVDSDLKPIMADTLHGNGLFSITDRLKFSFGYTQDTWSGATPISTVPLASNAGNLPFTRILPNGEIVSGASPFVNGEVLLGRNMKPLRTDGTGADSRKVLVLSSASPETRTQGDFGLSYEWDEAALNLNGGLSLERDYESVYGSASGRFDFNQKMTSLNWGAGYASSKQSSKLDHDTLGYVTNLAYADRLKLAYNLVLLEGNRHDWTANLGLTQILGKESLVDFNFGYTRSEGFMENPYKAVTVIFVDPDRINPDPNIPISGNLRAVLEQRPDLRNQFAFSGKLVQYIRPTDAALHLGYKLSFDDWGIFSNTFEGDWVQPLPGGWTITPRIRYYSQSSANFYQPYVISGQAFTKTVTDENGGLQTILYDPKKLPKHMSSDHRLSGYGSLSGGVTLNKKFARGVELEAGFEYYTRASALKLGGGNSSFADFDYYVANAAFKIDMDAVRFFQSSPSRQSSGQGHHNHGGHMHTSSPVPAGVMYGHMADQAGEFMLGYRFMYSWQYGKMRYGTRFAEDREIVNLGCLDGRLCKYAPEYMDMRMHMLDIMYAPTDWMTLMLMPQFMDMDMGLREPEGRPPPDPAEHRHAGMPHTTGAVGDTVMAALIRLADRPGHHLHMGLGVSAPSGRVGLKLRRRLRKDGGLTHFDMMLGSGTWDFLPSLTYTGDAGRWYWGGQLSGTVRMEDRNESGYRLGNVFQSTVWGGVNLTKWLSASVRGAYMQYGKVHGDYNSFNDRVGPMDYPDNLGGRFWDAGFGLNVSIPKGRFAGNQIAVEWLQPLHDDYNGYQQKRTGALHANWSYHF